MEAPTCNICKHRPSYFKRENDGTALCKSCFKASVERRVRRTVSHWKMFSPSDRIAVAVSGGKDSVTLLMILKKLTSKFPHATLTAVTVDEGIAGYREEAVDLAALYCRKLEVKHEMVSFQDLYGQGLDDFLRGKSDRMSACAYCGVFRRRAINVAAKKVGATKIATAHNLDDIVQTYLLNLLEGDVERFARFGPVLQDPRGRFLPRVKPLCEIPEREVAMYGYSEGLTFQGTSCPYMSEALRNELRTILNRLEISHPGILFSSYSAMTRLRKLSLENIPASELGACDSCGEPTPSQICEACRMQGITKTLLKVPA